MENRGEQVKQWHACPEYGSVTVTVAENGILVHVADDAVQRRYEKRCSLTEFSSEASADGWVPFRKIVADDFSPEQRLEIETYLSALLGALWKR